MASKQVTDRQKSGLAVVASGRAHAAEVERVLADRFAAALGQGQRMPDFETMMALGSAELEGRVQAMVQADEAHERELGDDAGPRRERDGVAERLSARVVELREIVVGVYGREAAEGLGFVERTPQDPVVLERFARRIAQELVDRGLPASRVAGARLDAAEVARGLVALCDALARALGDVAREEREAQATLGRRNDAMNTYDKSFSGIANLQAALLRLAGRDDLADRVRPSPRSPGRTEAQAGETTGTETTVTP